MNDAPIKPDDATTETRPEEISEPHFDEIAVLIAQPVEPIAKRERDWFAWVEKPQTLLAIVFISSMMGITALALTLQLQTQPHVDTAATEIQTEQNTSSPESPVVADTEQQSASPRPPKTSKTGSRVQDDSKHKDDDSKPKARRVGVIYYGSSSDRP